MTATNPADDWLKDDKSRLYLILHALAGDCRRADSAGAGGTRLALFTLALAGNKKALAVLETGRDLGAGLLHGLAENCQQSGWLAERPSRTARRLRGDQGDEGPLRRLKGKKPGLTKLARLVRAAAKSDDGLAETASGGAADVAAWSARCT